MEYSENRLISYFKDFSEYSSIILIIIGILILIGWVFDITILKSPGPNFSTIKSNVALCFILIGASLWLQQTKRINKRNQQIAQILAVIVALIGFLTIMEHLFNLNFGIDQILFTEPLGALNTSAPNRMAFNSAFALLLTGISILILDKKIGRYRPAQLLMLIEGFVTFLALMGYVYNASNLYTIYQYTGTAIYAAITLLLIFFAVLSARPDKGFMKVVVGEGLGSVFGRRILLTVLLIPIILIWLQLLGEKLQYYDEGFGAAILAVSMVLILVIVVWNAMISLNKTDIRRRRNKEEIKHKNRILDGINTIFRATITNTDEEEFGKTCLAVCEELTGSEFSFIGGINENGRFDSIAVSERGWQACEMVKEQGAESVDDNVIRGIRGRALEEKKILIFNDPTNSPYWSGLPDGHYPINSFLGAPLIYRDKVVGLIALANKKEGYSKEDIEVMEVITTAITESLMHYRALNQLEENRNELERSNKELQSFAYITSHDLQEPLRTMSSYAGLLKMRYEGQFDQDADDFLEYMVKGAQRMKGMIQGLLDYSRVGTKEGEFIEFSSEEALNNALYNLHSSIEECHAKVTYDKLPTIIADKDQISRVFQNLIGNALKFLREGVQPKIHISAQKTDNEHVFSVSDNGIGIEPQYTDRIFEVFKRLHAIGEYQGAGIGLAVVKRIVERHEGRVWVESSFGVGSTFYFTIPIRK